MNYGHRYKAIILDAIKAGDLTETGAFVLFGMTSLEIKQLQAAREKYGEQGLMQKILRKRRVKP